MIRFLQVRLARSRLQRGPSGWLAVVVGLVVLTLERLVTAGGPGTLSTLRTMLRAAKLLQGHPDVAQIRDREYFCKVRVGESVASRCS
jgi:hypothetical protein